MCSRLVTAGNHVTSFWATGFSADYSVYGIPVWLTCVYQTRLKINTIIIYDTTNQEQVLLSLSLMNGHTLRNTWKLHDL